MAICVLLTRLYLDLPCMRARGTRCSETFFIPIHLSTDCGAEAYSVVPELWNGHKGMVL